jgi:hypothetical protein
MTHTIVRRSPERRTRLDGRSCLFTPAHLTRRAASSSGRAAVPNRSVGSSQFLEFGMSRILRKKRFNYQESALQASGTRRCLRGSTLSEEKVTVTMPATSPLSRSFEMSPSTSVLDTTARVLVKPRWDRIARKLWWGNCLIKEFPRPSPLFSCAARERRLCGNNLLGAHFVCVRTGPIRVEDRDKTHRLSVTPGGRLRAIRPRDPMPGLRTKKPKKTKRSREHFFIPEVWKNCPPFFLRG